jgi:hypothetical protein
MSSCLDLLGPGKFYVGTERLRNLRHPDLIEVALQIKGKKKRVIHENKITFCVNKRRRSVFFSHILKDTGNYLARWYHTNFPINEIMNLSTNSKHNTLKITIPNWEDEDNRRECTAVVTIHFSDRAIHKMQKQCGC